MLQNRFLFLHKLFHLLDKISFHLGNLMYLLHCCPLTDCLIHEKMPFTGRSDQPVEQFFLRERIKILGMAQTITPRLQRADSLLESFFVGLADAHDFSHGTHLGPQLVLHALELFKSPAGKFNNHIIAVRYIFI